MNTGDLVIFCVLLLLIFLSGFFSSAETALTTANLTRLKVLAEEGNRRAAAAIKLKERPSQMLSAILIGNNLVNNFISAIATALTIHMFGGGAIGIVTTIVTILVLIFGEITPKTIAAVNAEKLSLLYSSYILFLVTVMTPVIYMINYICRFFLRLMHIDPDGTRSPMTEMELRTIVDESHQDGVIEKSERQMIYNVFDFGDSVAKDVMVPRADMISVSETFTREEIYEIFCQEKYTRLPVYREDPDHVIGILNIKDFFFHADPDHFSVSDLMYEPYYTYETKKTSELLLEMQKKSASLAIVLDEYGAAAGMVSLEDLLEEIVGEIRDEYDEDEKNLIRKTGEREYRIEGAVKLDDINDRLALSLHSDNYDSVGGLLIELLDHVPSQGESVVLENGILLTADRMDRNRIEYVRLKLPIQQTAGANTQPQ